VIILEAGVLLEEVEEEDSVALVFSVERLGIGHLSALRYNRVLENTITIRRYKQN